MQEEYWEVKVMVSETKEHGDCRDCKQQKTEFNVIQLLFIYLLITICRIPVSC